MSVNGWVSVHILSSQSQLNQLAAKASSVVCFTEHQQTTRSVRLHSDILLWVLFESQGATLVNNIYFLSLTQIQGCFLFLTGIQIWLLWANFDAFYLIVKAQCLVILFDHLKVTCKKNPQNSDACFVAVQCVLLLIPIMYKPPTSRSVLQATRECTRGRNWTACPPFCSFGVKFHQSLIFFPSLHTLTSFNTQKSTHTHTHTRVSLHSETSLDRWMTSTTFLWTWPLPNKYKLTQILLSVATQCMTAEWTRSKSLVLFPSLPYPPLTTKKTSKSNALEGGKDTQQ